MRHVRAFLGALIGLLGEMMITIGVLIFAFAAWQLWWTDVVSNREVDAIRKELTADWSNQSQEVDPGATFPELPPDEVLVADPPVGEAFALLHVPRFGDSWTPRPVISGTGAEDLKTGVGYYEDTVGPGEVGNFSVAGHRVTYGRPFFDIETMQAGDPIVVETDKAWFTYRMTDSKIVPPSYIEAIAPVPGKPGEQPVNRNITLTACHPKFSARERYIVHGEFDSWQPKSAGRPSVLTTT